METHCILIKARHILKKKNKKGEKIRYVLSPDEVSTIKITSCIRELFTEHNYKRTT